MKRLDPASGRFLALLFAFALAVRLVFTQVTLGLDAPTAAEPEPDAPQYEELARNVYERGEYFQVLNGFTYRAYRSPLAPLLSAGLWRVTGYSRAATRVMHALVSSLAPLLLALLARRFAPPAWAAAVGLYAAVYPFHVFYAGLFLTEALFIPLLCAAVLAMTRACEDPSPREGALAGACLGLVALTRPVAWPLLACLALALLARHGFARPAARAFAAACLALALFAAPWFARNYLALGALIPGDTHGGNTLWGAYNHGLFRHPEFIGSWYLPAPHEVPPEYRYDPLADDEPAQDRTFYALARRFIREHPEALPYFVWRRFVRFFSAWPSGPAHRKIASVVFYGPLLPLALLGAWRLRGRWRELLPVHLTLLVALSLSLVTVASVRMRNPVDGFLMILAAAGVAGAGTGRGSAPDPAGGPEALRPPPAASPDGASS